MTIRTAKAKIQGVTPYSQGRAHEDPKNPGEGADDYDARTWRSRLHVGRDGRVFVPPMAFKICLAEAAKFRGQQIPGKGKSTYTKHFEAGVAVLAPMVLSVKAADVPCERVFVPADGIRGSGKRVWKRFPFIEEWGGEVEFTIFDPVIKEDVFREHLEHAGRFIGVGRYRPRNNGFYGRFDVIGVKWS